MKTIMLLPLFMLTTLLGNAQGVSINRDGSPVSDTTSMLEIKKEGKSKVRIVSTNYSDTVQLEMSNRNIANQGTNMLISANREEGLLFSSNSDVANRLQDSIFSIRFQSAKKTFFGFNIKNLAALLHVHDPSSTLTSIRLTNNSTGVIGSNGVSLTMNGLNASLVNAESGQLNFGTGNIVWAGFNAAGNLGVGLTNASERLGVVGNIDLSGSNKGILLDAQDRPMITRGWDLFSSGNYAGLGRWGLFMEPSRLTLGFPHINGAGVRISTYNANSTRGKDILNVSLDASLNATMSVDAKITRPSSGNANLVPIAYGTIDASAGGAGILNGTSNFTVTRSSLGIYRIDIAGETYSATNHTAQVSICSNGTSTFISCYPSDGALYVVTVNFNAIDRVDRDFCFTVYRAN